MSWKDDKNLGPWSFTKQPDKPYYNEGDEISSYESPVWNIDFTGIPITPVHVPCGYWASVPGEYLANKWGYVLGKWVKISDEDKDEGEYLGGDYLAGNSFGACLPGFAMSWDENISPETIIPGDDSTIAFTTENGSAGGGPFLWDVSGIGTSLEATITTGSENILYTTDQTSCGTITVYVVDSCGNGCLGYIRCTTGQWILKSNDCQMAGKAGDLEVLNFHFQVTCIQGYQKQYTIYDATGVATDLYDTCSAAIASIAPLGHDCLTFTVPCSDIWPVGDAVVWHSPRICRNLNCNWVSGPKKWRMYYRRYDQVTHNYYEWEC